MSSFENLHGLSGDDRTTRQYVEFADKHAAVLRQRANVSATAPINPFALTDAFGIVVVKLEDITDLSPAEREEIAKIDAKVWGGGGKALPNGQALVILNPSQTLERANVTVMEEVAHSYLGHKPTRLFALPDGTYKRDYDPVIEREAYWTAAATLLPSSCVGKAVWRRRPGMVIAKEFGVSVELVEFRIKTLRLWEAYCSYQKREGEFVA